MSPVEILLVTGYPSLTTSKIGLVVLVPFDSCEIPFHVGVSSIHHAFTNPWIQKFGNHEIWFSFTLFCNMGYLVRFEGRRWTFRSVDGRDCCSSRSEGLQLLWFHRMEKSLGEGSFLWWGVEGKIRKSKGVADLVFCVVKACTFLGLVKPRKGKKSVTF